MARLLDPARWPGIKQLPAGEVLRGGKAPAAPRGPTHTTQPGRR